MRAKFRVPLIPVDSETVCRELGARVATLRVEKGLTQTDMGTALGVSFQQIQKYERGYNQIGVTRLLQVAMVLGVSAAELLDGLSVHIGVPIDRALSERQAV